MRVTVIKTKDKLLKSLETKLFQELRHNVKNFNDCLMFGLKRIFYQQCQGTVSLRLLSFLHFTQIIYHRLIE